MSPGTAVFLTVTSTSTEVGMTYPSGIHADYVSGGPVAHTPEQSLVPPTSAASSTKNTVASQGKPASAPGSTAGDATPSPTHNSVSVQTPVAESAPEPSGSAVDSITRKLPTVIMPMPLAFTDAQGDVVTSTALGAAAPLPAQASPPHAHLPQGAQVNPASAHSPVLTVGSHTITANAKNQYIIGSQTLTPGGGITVSGTPVSLALGGSHAVVGGSTQLLSSQITPAVNLPPTLTLGNEAITADAQSRYIIGSQTLNPGGVISVSGMQISLDAGGIYAVVGSTTQTLAITPRPALTVGTETITPNAQGHYVIGSQTLNPGGIVTVFGTPISLAASGDYAIIGSSTENLAIPTPPPLTFGSQTITPNAAGQYIIDDQTLSPGSAITISGTPISLAADDSYAVIGSSTERLAGAITSPPTLTIGSQTVTANAQGQYIIDGQTLTPGGVVTVSGTRISLAADETDVVVGTSTEGLGGYIMGGFNPGGPSPSGGSNGTGPGVLGFAGGASSDRRVLWIEALLMGVGIMVVMYL